jgi:hypothetical protein
MTDKIQVGMKESVPCIMLFITSQYVNRKKLRKCKLYHHKSSGINQLYLEIKDIRTLSTYFSI